jgi:hypothetical protein
MLSLEEVRKRKTANTRKVTVVLDAEWGAKYAAVEKRVAELIEAGVGNVGGAEWAGLNAELERMRDEAPEHTVDLLVRGISNDRYERLLRAHPITADQRRAQASPASPAANMASSATNPIQKTGERRMSVAGLISAHHATGVVSVVRESQKPILIYEMLFSRPGQGRLDGCRLLLDYSGRPPPA